MHLIHLTDLHLIAPGARLFGLDPLARLDAALAHMMRHEPSAELLLITGDLTDRGEPAAYAALRQRLDAFTIKPLLLLGNHDDRPAFRAAFGETPLDPAGFVQQAIDTEEGLSLVTLDTHVPGMAHGELCGDRLAWLETTLAERSGRAVYLAMHHPPVSSRIPGMDAIGLRDEAGFWEVVGRAPHVRHIFAGHIHRPFFARRGTVSISTLPSPVHQVYLQFLAEGVELGSLEGGAYGIVELTPDAFSVHVRTFTDQAPKFVFSDASNAATTPEGLPPVPEAYHRFL